MRSSQQVVYDIIAKHAGVPLSRLSDETELDDLGIAKRDKEKVLKDVAEELRFSIQGDMLLLNMGMWMVQHDMESDTVGNWVQYAESKPRGGTMDFDSMSKMASQMGKSAIQMAIAMGQPPLVRRALEAKPDIDERSEPNGYSLVHLAVMGTDSADRAAIVKLLHEAGADMEVRSSDKGITPLHLASMRGQGNCVRALLDCGADVNGLDPNKATALHAASMYGHPDICSLLMKAGADPELVDGRGNSPISLAESRNQPKCAEVLQAAAGSSGRAERTRPASDVQKGKKRGITARGGGERTTERQWWQFWKWGS